MIYDIFTFNGEYDLLEIRLNILNDYVDQFIIVEADETFSGKPKPLYFQKERERYKQWNNKIKYFVVTKEIAEKYMTIAQSSPNTVGADHWKREFCQKEAIKDALVGLKDNDICFIGDVDEIWDYQSLLFLISSGYVEKIKLDVYTYYLNNHSSEEFWGTIVGKYKYIKDNCLNELRTNAKKTLGKYGWHFTSMGGYEEVKRKLSDSYTRESYWTENVEVSLKDNIEQRKDFLGRGFNYVLYEDALPQYLKDNKQKWIHLFRS
jgi:beta-1,4-mannosyl-glycoprotein beta-1,4-N-acetylglucosaminyltransferase